ncbi:SOS response-associated peptidase [Patescibacteria group bacterium]
MCGRFDIQLPPERLGKLYQADIAAIEDYTPRYNVAPSQFVPALFGDAGRTFDFARFGMRPKWLKLGSRDLINLRRETVSEKPFFRRLLESNRCVVPVTGFFEWQGRAGNRVPYRFVPSDTETFPLACVWSTDLVQAKKLTTFAVLTGPPNEKMKPVHDRMPVILDPERLDAWLAPDTPLKEVEAALKVFPAGRMDSHRVSTQVNSPANDSPDVVAPLT